MFKLFKTCQPNFEFINQNFQYNQHPRQNHINFFKRQNYDTEKPIIKQICKHQ